jgi:hypothetical protein
MLVATRSAQNNRDSWLVRVRLDYNSLITRSLTARAVNETSWSARLLTRRVRTLISSARGYPIHIRATSEPLLSIDINPIRSIFSAKLLTLTHSTHFSLLSTQRRTSDLSTNFSFHSPLFSLLWVLTSLLLRILRLRLAGFILSDG